MPAGLAQLYIRANVRHVQCGGDMVSNGRKNDGEMALHKLLAAGLVTASFAAATSAQAVPQLGIQIYIDGALGALLPLTAGGTAILTDTGNPFFNTISVTSTGAPVSPDPNFGTISINASAAFATGSHTLTLISTQINLTGGAFGSLASTFTYNGLSNPSNITSAVGQNFIDAGNGAFAQTTLIANTPNEGGTVAYSSGTITYSPIPPPLFSETEVYSITFTGLALEESSAQIIGTGAAPAPAPEPISLALLSSGLVGLSIVRRNKR